MEEYNIEDALKSIFDSKETNWKPADKIPLVAKEIEHVKLELKTYLEGSDYDLKSIYKESQDLCEESASLMEAMEACRAGIEKGTMAEILTSIENHDMLAAELETVNFAVSIVQDILTCGRYLKDFDAGRERHSYPQAVQAAYELLQLVNNPSEGFNCLDIYNNVKHIAQSNMDAILDNLYEEWHRMISWNVKAGNRKTAITITLTTNETKNTTDILHSLNKCKKLDEKISEFSQFLLKEVLDSIIHNDCTVCTKSDELLTITVMHKQDVRPTYDSVISNLRLLFYFLSNKLHVLYDEDNTILMQIGKQIYVEFSKILVEDCLKDTVPNNMQELQNYGLITSEIEDFEQFLIALRFFPRDGDSILEYIENIDTLFAEKSSQYFLETARTIMFKDLSVTMSIGVEHIPESSSSPEESGDKNVVEALKVLDRTIPKSLFYFPRCMISRSAQELLDLVYVLMEQAVQCSDIVCKKLYITTRLVFELYDAVVPYHHENYLHNIPQYVALFHNNCMYLAHNLQTFGDKWLIHLDGREIDYPISFVDLVPKIRELGYKYLTIHMQQQRKQILDNIRSSDLNCIVVKDVLGDNAEAAIRMCLRQLQLLKNVWIGVFPANVFTRLMATLVNMFVDELIHRVCTVEDISMEMATQLTEMYTLVVQKVPQMFQKPSDAEDHVKSWVKLQELIFILGGSLKDIENHWNDGTGPLAIHYKTEELRNLIKALFQNTQFRANLLSKIK